MMKENHEQQRKGTKVEIKLARNCRQESQIDKITLMISTS